MQVLQHAPCSVAILIDRGVGGNTQVAPNNVDHKVAVYFFGGQDDREALAYGLRMGEHPGIQVHVIRFVGSAATTTSADHVGIDLPSAAELSTQGLDPAQERKLDEAALEQVGKVNGISMEELQMSQPTEAVLEAARSRPHDIILVGRSPRVAKGMALRQPEYPELGPLGDALTAADVRASVLVFQQYDPSFDSLRAPKATPV